MFGLQKGLAEVSELMLQVAQQQGLWATVVPGDVDQSKPELLMLWLVMEVVALKAVKLSLQSFLNITPTLKEDTPKLSLTEYLIDNLILLSIF